MGAAHELSRPSWADVGSLASYAYGLGGREGDADGLEADLCWCCSLLQNEGGGVSASEMVRWDGTPDREGDDVDANVALVGENRAWYRCPKLMRDGRAGDGGGDGGVVWEGSCLYETERGRERRASQRSSSTDSVLATTTDRIAHVSAKRQTLTRD